MNVSTTLPFKLILYNFCVELFLSEFEIYLGWIISLEFMNFLYFL